MPKLEIDVVAEVLNENEFDGETVTKIVRQLNRRADQLAAEAEESKEPQVKKQFCILISDPSGSLPDEDMVGWVVQIPENDNPGVLVDRIKKAAYDHNCSRRGRKNPVKSIGEACEVVGSKHLKEHKVWIKTKLLVTAMKTDNVLPADDGRISADDLRMRVALP